MGKKTGRKRRASLHGWWKVLPFLLGPMVLFMTFAYWESARIRNQFATNDRKTMIEEIRKEIEDLQVTNHELASIKRMARRAPSMDLQLPTSDQLVVVPPIAIERSLADKATFLPAHAASSSPARSVLIRIEYELAENTLVSEEEENIHAQESTEQD